MQPGSLMHQFCTLHTLVPFTLASKNPPPQRDFLKLREISLFFCQCKRSLQSRRYYSGFGHVIRDLQRNDASVLYIAHILTFSFERFTFSLRGLHEG